MTVTGKNRIIIAHDRRSSDDQLIVQPHCLMYFVDETGHEDFADPKYPVFGLGGCAILMANIERDLRRPWREIKSRHFGGADVPLHASDLRSPMAEQVEALGAFFREQPIGRFAVTMTKQTSFPAGVTPMNIMPGALRRRWEELTPRFDPLPTELAFIHEASDRGDDLLERFFGQSVVMIDGKRVHAHHGIMPKGDEALEVADFIIQAAGAQALRGIYPDRPLRKDFDAIFNVNPLWRSFQHISNVTAEGPIVSADGPAATE